jgi:hypothetical protein
MAGDAKVRGTGMRTVVFAVLGLILGAGVALMVALPQSEGARAVDAQGMHLLGVLFLALPAGATLGLVAGLVLARTTRR